MTEKLIDEFLPAYDVRSRHGTDVHASPKRTYEAVRELDMSGSLLIRTLFRLREVPARSLGRTAPYAALGLTLEGLLDAGFTLLGERAGEEIVLGVIGRFWRVAGDIQRVDPEAFRSFERPGYAKAVWNFRVVPRGDVTRLLTETRVLCTDDASRRKFRLYWTVIGPFSGLIRWEILRSVKKRAEMG